MKRFDKVNPDPTIEEMRAVVCDQKASTITLHTITITIIVNTIYINIIIIIIIMVYCRLDQSSWEPGRRTLSCDVLQRSAKIFRLFDETDFHLKNPVSLQVMHECWFENTLARLSALRIKKNLTEIQVL